jgi:hypothetical protein
MRIQFGPITNLDDACCTFLFGSVVFAITCFNTHLHSLFGDAEVSILRSRGLNVTRISPILYCDLPYDDCLCPVLLNKSNISENCIAYYQLVSSRILPLVSFFLQIYLVRKLFSLNADHRRVVIYALWIISIFTCIGMRICIYWSSCYQLYITLTLYLTYGILWVLCAHNIGVNMERLPSFSHGNKVAGIHSLGRNNESNKAWQELP